MSLFSEEFMDFFQKVPINAASVEELSGHIAKAVSPVADLMGIGKLEITMVHSPATPFSPQINNGVILLYYYKDGYQDKPVTDYYTTGINGNVELHTYPRKDINWSDDDLRYIHSLASVLYTICAKAQITSVLNIAAYTDGATGISNSLGVYQFIGSLCARGVEAAYTGLFMNIKNFRYVNQRYGGKNGDIVLKKYATRIKDFLESDETVGRMGGDNFVAIVKNEHLNDFLDFISKIRIPLNLNAKMVSTDIETRAGIYPIAAGDTVSVVMNNISIAINIAKNSQQHNFIWFRPNMMTKSMHDKELASSFSSALENKEFEVYYQPKVNLKTNELCGSEALVRWRKAERLLQPDDFVPVLEKEGSICALDFYVLERVCENIRVWLDNGLTPVRVSTNFSKLHMHNPKLADDIIKVIERHNVDPAYIEIELTETIGYEDFEALSEFVRRLHDYGLHTSIDDFGTGYSSLNLVSELEVDVIKLDKSFLTPEDKEEHHDDIERIKHRTKSNIIVIKTLISMAVELGISVICEGVETKEQAELLKELGCEMAQGYLYDRPMPWGEFENRLKNTKYDV